MIGFLLFCNLLYKYVGSFISKGSSPNLFNGATFFICSRNACITINAWKAQHNINRLTENNHIVDTSYFLSLLASLFKDKQLIYNLLTNLCGYFKAELLNEKELSSLINTQCCQ